MNESKATRYQRYRRRAAIAAVISGVSMLAVVALTPLARWLAMSAEAFGTGLPDLPRGAIALVIFVMMIVLLWELAALPAMLFLRLRIDPRFNQRAVTVEDVLAAQAQAALVAIPAALIAAAAIRLSVWVAGDWWWAVAGALLALALVAALHGVPALLARLADARPLDRPELAERLADLARRSRIAVSRIDELQVDDAARATALLAGAGPSRRIFVSSALARDWSDDEIAVVVAHELGHHARRDLWRTLVLDASILSIALWVVDVTLRFMPPAFGLVGARDLAALPLVVVVGGLVWLMLTPLRHAHSRLQERRADEFALALTGGADAFAATIRRLGARHLAEERPSSLTRWLFHRHPSVAERLALADSYRTVVGAGFSPPDDGPAEGGPCARQIK